MKDAAVDGTGAAPGRGASPRPPGLDRRRVLVLALLAPVAAAGLGACSTGPTRTTKGPDPLVALADAARADAALAAAAIASNPDLTARVEPLRAARTEHAAALDAEVVRAGGTPGSAAPTAAAPPSGASLRGPDGRPDRHRRDGEPGPGARGRRRVPARGRAAGAGPAGGAGRPCRVGRGVLRDVRGGAGVSGRNGAAR